MKLVAYVQSEVEAVLVRLYFINMRPVYYPRATQFLKIEVLVFS